MNKDKSHKDANKEFQRSQKNKISPKDVNKEKQHDYITTENSHKDVEKDKFHKYVQKKSHIKYVRKKNSLKDNMEKILGQMSGNAKQGKGEGGEQCKMKTACMAGSKEKHAY